jgi:hypothetical protein
MLMLSFMRLLRVTRVEPECAFGSAFLPPWLTLHVDCGLADADAFLLFLKALGARVWVCEASGLISTARNAGLSLGC